MLAHLAEVSIRSLLLALAAAVGLLILRGRRTAALQHAVWATVACGMLGLFVFGQVLPRLPLRILDSPAAALQITSPIAGVDRLTLDQTSDAVQLPPPVPATPRRSIDWSSIALCAYVAIALAFLARFVTGMFLIRRLVAKSTPVQNFLESKIIAIPLTVGWLRPRILLPLEWREWDREKLDAVLAHEGAHVRRRDGLVAALAGVNRCVFWFHPLAWMLERKLALLAEQACDEACVAALGDREGYARLLLEMARVVDGSQGRLRCHALTMAARSHIRLRIDSLLQEGRTFSRGLSWTGWAATVLCGIPLVLGAGAVELARQPPPQRLELPRLNVPAPPVLLAQARPTPPPSPAVQMAPAQATASGTPHFEVASIKPCTPVVSAGARGGGAPPIVSPGRLSLNCIPVERLIQQAYIQFADGKPSPSGRAVPISGGPAWISSERYDIEARAEGDQSPEMMRGPMMQALLEDRFNLRLHRETREVPVYALTVAKGGPKLQVAQDGRCVPRDPGSPLPQRQPGVWPCGVFAPSSTNDGSYMYGTTLANFSLQLSAVLDRDVIDKTGISGVFDIHVEAPSTAPPPGFVAGGPRERADPTDLTDLLGSAIFTVVQKLGLKLESTKDTGNSLVIDHVDRPSQN